MSENILIACRMQQDEIEKYKKQYAPSLTVEYLPRGMHKNPDELKTLLQAHIERYQDVDTILLSYGLCGGAADGLVSKRTRLVMPRFHDCIHQLLENRVDKETLYMTRAWTIDKESILGQCEAVRAQYGAVQGQEILTAVYGGYKRIQVIDTKSYELKPIKENAEKAAGILGMHTGIEESGCHIIKKLLRGDWENGFLVLAPGEAVKRAMFFC